MQKFSIVSDLHLEFAPLVMPGGELLIISGDSCEVKNFNPNYVPESRAWEDRPTGNDVRRLNTLKFFTEELPKYDKVICVMGNHEHYQFKFDKTLPALRQRLADAGVKNVTVLENETVELDGTLFIGATLWTDCNKNNPMTMNYLADAMNDYKAITKHYLPENKYYRLLPKVTYDVHQETKKFIEQTLLDNPGKPTVVVTHHAPTLASIPEEYRHDFHMNGGYASDLSDLILDNPQIKFWTHGHIHTQFDYMIGTTRILCNPRGYAGYERRAQEFDPGLEFDIPK